MPCPATQVLEWFRGRGLEAYSISCGQSLLYNNIFPKHKVGGWVWVWVALVRVWVWLALGVCGGGLVVVVVVCVCEGWVGGARVRA